MTSGRPRSRIRPAASSSIRRRRSGCAGYDRRAPHPRRRPPTPHRHRGRRVPAGPNGTTATRHSVVGRRRAAPANRRAARSALSRSTRIDEPSGPLGLELAPALGALLDVLTVDQRHDAGLVERLADDVAHRAFSNGIASISRKEHARAISVGPGGGEPWLPTRRYRARRRSGRGAARRRRAARSPGANEEAAPRWRPRGGPAVSSRPRAAPGRDRRAGRALASRARARRGDDGPTGQTRRPRSWR